MNFAAGLSHLLYKKLRHFCRNRSAATALIFALSAVPIMLTAGGALDYTRYYDTQQSIQTALDAAVLAGAANDNNDTTATNTFSSWPVKFNGTLGTPTFTPSETDEASYYAGTVDAHLDMYFARLIGMSQLDFTITAKAVRLKTTDGSGGTPCAWIGQGGMKMGDESRFMAPNCPVDVRGGDTNFGSGSRMMTTQLCLGPKVSDPYFGGKIYDPNQRDPREESCPEPVAYTMPPQPSFDGCDHSDALHYYYTAPQTNSGRGDTPTSYTSYHSITLKPGTFCGGVHFHGGPDSSHPMQITLAPGLYIIKGAPFEFDGYAELYGYGVSFYFVDAKSWLKFDGDHITSELSAPTSGDCESDDRCGVLMFEPSSLANDGYSTPTGFSYGASHAWTGNIMLPSRWIGHDSDNCDHDHHMDLYGRMAVYGMHVCGDSRWRVWPRKTVHLEACPMPRPQWWPLFRAPEKVCTPDGPHAQGWGGWGDHPAENCSADGTTFANKWWYSWWHYWRRDTEAPRTNFFCSCPGPEGSGWTYGHFPDGTQYTPADWHDGRYAYPSQAPWPYHRACACHSETWHPWHKICEDSSGNYTGGGGDDGDGSGDGDSSSSSTYSTPHLVE